MNIDEYKEAIIDLFYNSKATDDQWEAMAEAVLYTSESDAHYKVKCIDDIVDPLRESVEFYED